MAYQDGDVIEFDYEMWVDGRDQLFDTTLREAADKAGIAEPNAFYAPMAYVFGSGRLIPGLEEALKQATVGKTEEVDLAADQAYGPRDAKLIETLPLGEFKKNDVEPQPGLEIRHKNRRGVITTVGGGRVRVDFNPPLAGKRLKYRFTVRRAAKDDGERLAGLLRMNFPAPFDWKVQVVKGSPAPTATVEVPEGVVYDQRWMTAKLRTLIDARRFTPFATIRFVEAYSLERKEESMVEKTAPA